MIWGNFRKSVEILALAPGALSRNGWLLVAPEEREETERHGIGARGRRRRPGMPEHARNVVSIVPTDLRDVWSRLNWFLPEFSKVPHF